ncbi:hypothetical protein JCM19992_01360 [Thermostilla marina]
MKRALLVVSMVLLTAANPAARFASAVDAKVAFDRPVREWDGFGVNYVEAAQTRDYAKHPQEYGGFSLLSERQRQEIVELVFGDEGLKPGVVKMFLDPFHEGMTEADNDNDDPYKIDEGRFDHETTTRWMRYFVREGLERTRARGDDLTIITTLYGPPGWMTKQKFVRGRDLDPAMKEELAEYLAAWVSYLRKKEGFPVKYVSLHNEGEDKGRWPADGSTAGEERHDYNMYWPPEQVAEMIPIVRKTLDAFGLNDVGVTPGETTIWPRFSEWGYARAIAENETALEALGLITSHGFARWKDGKWTNHTSAGIDLLRAKRPELHAWTTSMTWGQMNVRFVEDLARQIYICKVNCVIPWAAIQTADWYGGDPNPGTAIRVTGTGEYTVEPGYYWYKQACRAGQPGMMVAEVESSDPQIVLMAFASNGTRHPDAFVVINTGYKPQTVNLSISGTTAARFAAFRTSDDEHYQPLDDAVVEDGSLTYRAPPRSATTFFAK